MYQKRLLNIYKRFQEVIRRYPRVAFLLAATLIAWLFCLPRPLFDAPFSAVLEDRQGGLLGARIAADGQWRFPYNRRVPDKYATCVTTFEDQRFWYHPGVDPISLARSMWQNLRRGRVVSGGSTLTMQVIRLARNNPPRTVWEKCVEIFQATRLELTWRKRSILGLYAAHAPFGGNVVGLEAATWRYYGKQPELLTWAEAATLAVLPNSPALIHPGRNRNTLLAKRNRLLERLRDRGDMDATECELAQAEGLPNAPLPLPQLAPHLLTRLAGQDRKGDQRFHSTLDANLQAQVQEVLTRRQAQYQGNEVHNLAAVIIDVPTGEVLAYVGNVSGIGAAYQEHVDVIQAARSTGSILKPYLYAMALESGDMLPQSLLQDVPTQLGRYKPENFFESYDGAVPAKRALVRSLNVPFVLLLQQHGLEKFHFELQQLGLSTLNKPPAHYGLSLILGGAEANLLDITNVYASMARRLGGFYTRDGRWATNDFRPPVFALSSAKKQPKLSRQAGIGPTPAAIWHTFEAMQEVERPNSSGEWELFRAGQKIAWKTGTSFGFRDAWAAGVTPRYAVGVWVGNADGEGRPGLIGVEMAAPVLFELFGLLPGGTWFDPPYDNMTQVRVCQQSGFRAGPHCDADTAWIPKTGLQAPACPYHQLLHLDASGQWQVHSDCEAPDLMRHQPWFVLSPIEEFYFKNKHPEYQSPPPFRADCLGTADGQTQPMQLIYPRQPTRIYVPTELDGSLGSTVFQIAHRKPEITVHWHLDGQFLGSTQTFHQMALSPPVGKHLLAAVDADGNRVEQVFEVIGK